MKPIHQTKFGNAEGAAAGNCLQAALASLLDLALDDVPHFVSLPDAMWFHALDQWLEDHYDLHVIYLSREQVSHPDLRGYGLQIGKSPRGAFHHVVVTYNGEMVHDPHPDGTGLTEVTGDYLLVRRFEARA